jgi:predicted porin
MYRKDILAAVCCLAGASVASAQNNVTVYGHFDSGINYISNVQTGRVGGALQGDSVIRMLDGTQGGLAGSRWGVRTNEDLGGGLSAQAVLEGGFAPNSGAMTQGGTLFGRQVFIGLKSNAGTITFGRQYDPMRDFVQPLTAAGQLGGAIGARPGDIDNMANTRRVNNSIKYSSPNIGNIKFGALVSLGEVAGTLSRNQVIGVGASYTGSKITAAGAYLSARNPNFSYFGTNQNASTSVTGNNLGFAGSATSAQFNPVFAGFASANRMDVASIGVTLPVQAFTFGANYSHIRFIDLGDTATSGPNPVGYSGTATFRSPELNVQYRLSENVLFGAAYTYMHLDRANFGDGAIYRQQSIGASYSFSKRTQLYAIAVTQRATGTDSLNQNAVATIDGLTPSATSRQSTLRLGIRHWF